MKKYTLIVLALILALALCACGDDPAPTDPTGTTGGNVTDIPTTPVGYTFTYNGVQFGVDISVDNVLTQLGEPKDEYTSESCAFGGQDTVYYYSSIQISTNDEFGYDRIYSIYLEDDLVSTEEGICVGSSADDVKSAYGDPSDSSTDTSLVYEKDGMTLTFVMDGDTVSSIRYDA